jgi:hypothetical protein
VRRLCARWRAAEALAPAAEEAARDCVARAQAALFDDHRAGAQRQLLELFDLLVVPLDRWAQQQAEAAETLSCAVGLLGLWEELCDVDVEHERMEELLVWHAGSAEPDRLASQGAAGWSLGKSPAEQAELKRQVGEALTRAALPQSSFWRRLARRAAVGMGDLGHVSVQRGPLMVLERPPPAAAGGSAGEDGAPDWSTDLGELRSGDRLTLRWPMDQAGRLAVLHAVSAESAGSGDAELELLMPQDASEQSPRRQHEVVEVAGELAAVPGCPGHSLVVIWVPAVVPPGWAGEVLLRRRVPPAARIWRYTYRIFGPGPAAG